MEGCHAKPLVWHQDGANWSNALGFYISFKKIIDDEFGGDFFDIGWLDLWSDGSDTLEGAKSCCERVWQKYVQLNAANESLVPETLQEWAWNILQDDPTLDRGVEAVVP